MTGRSRSAAWCAETRFTSRSWPANSARALMDMSVHRRLALGNGILTTDTIGQAAERADPGRGDKGGDAARAAIGLALLGRRLTQR